MCFNKTDKLKEVRVYCECYEQGLYLLNYIQNNINIKKISQKVIYTKPGNFSNHYSNSLVSQIMAHKDFDGLISVIDSNNQEHLLVGIEFSSAVPVDDHIMQRFDVMYWSSFYYMPCIKISPTEMTNTDFGGGTKIKIEHEYYTTLNMKGIYYHINWPLIENTDLVVTDNRMISCPPHLDELSDLLNDFVNSYCNSKSDKQYYEREYQKYKSFVINNYKDLELDFSNSSRINFDVNGKLTLKFNRFGHGMDPERGMLLFWSQRLLNKPIVKFEIQRENKQKYESLFDGPSSDQIMNIVDREVLNNNNTMSFETAFKLFKKATNTEELFRNCIINNKNIKINDLSLKNYIKRNTSVVNNLLHFGEKIILTDLNDNIIVEICWNKETIEQFYIELRNNINSVSMMPLPLNILPNSRINEDAVTYACMSVFMLNNMQNIAVSYPGAQGDRKLLQGSGVTVKRDYVDIISIHKYCDNKYDVFLQENKKKVSQTQKSDIDKLNSIRNSSEKMNELNGLISKVFTPIIIKGCYIGVGGQESPLAQGETRFDYLMYVMIDDNSNINWQILSSNPIVFEIFKEIADRNNILRGTIKLNYPMYIVE